MYLVSVYKFSRIDAVVVVNAVPGEGSDFLQSALYQRDKTVKAGTKGNIAHIVTKIENGYSPYKIKGIAIF